MVEYGDARMKNFASDVILAKNQMHSYAKILWLNTLYTNSYSEKFRGRLK